MADEIVFEETMGDNIFARAVWAAMCEDGTIFEKLGITATSPRGQVLTIECKIGGIEVSLKGYLERLEKHMARQVQVRAYELFTDYLNSSRARNRLEALSNILDKCEKEMIAEFPEYNDR